MKRAAAREDLVLTAIRGELGDTMPLQDLVKQCAFPPTLIETAKLNEEFLLAQTLWEPCERLPTTMSDIVAKLQDKKDTVKDCMPNVMKMVKLVLTSPSSVASCERSFSNLRRFKTWVRSRMSQRRLTWLAIGHIHKDIVDIIPVRQIMAAFVEKSPERLSTFGRF